MEVTFKSKLLILLMSIFLLGSFVGATAEDCSVENIDTQKCFDTIQAAIDDGETDGGDIIEVSSGLYKEHVRVDKSITLQGPNSNVDPTDEGVYRKPEAEIFSTKEEVPSLTVEADDVRISGFKLNGDSLFARDGILVEWGNNNVTIKNNYVLGYREYPIRLQHVSGASIENNLIKENGEKFRDSDGTEYVEDYGGIRTDNSSDIYISGNKIIENGLTGINIINSAPVTVIGNTAKENHISPCGLPFDEAIESNNCHLEGSGIDISHTDNAEIIVDDNVFSHNDRGSVVGEVKGAEFSYNDFNNNLLHGIHILSSDVSFHHNDVIGNGRFGGVEIIGGSGNRVFDNDIENNDSSGIGISGHGRWSTTQGNELISNDVIGNRWGISIGGSSHGNKVERNIIKNNESGINLHGYTVDEDTTNPQNASIAYTRSLAQNIKPQSYGLKTMSDTNDGDINYFPSNNEVIDNTLSHNNTGIDLGNATNNDIKDNTISHGDWGIKLWQGTNGSLIFDNEISYISEQSIVLNRASGVIAEENNIDKVNGGIRVEDKFEANNGDNNTVEITDNEFTNIENEAIKLSRVTGIEVKNNEIDSNGKGLLWRGHGVVKPEDKNIIKGNIINPALVGIRTEHVPNVEIRENKINPITQDRSGILILSSPNSQIIDNEVIEGLRGIYVARSSESRVWDNKTLHNDESGIILRETKNSNVKRNLVEGNKHGIVVVWAKLNKILNNKITNNENGIVLTLEAVGNKIGSNDILNNDYGIWLPKEDPQLHEPNNARDNIARCNAIAGNSEFGVLNEMDYESHPEYKFDAKYNWWGHPSGPEVVVGKPNKPNPPVSPPENENTKGKGDRISGGVLYKPWLKKPPEESPHCPIFLSEGASLSNSTQKEGFNIQDFQASSNPVVSNEQVTFKATGEGINEVKVAVFDAKGEQLYDSGFVSGNTISWNARTQSGQPLSNGIYLFRMVAKGSGELVKSGVRKLLVIK